MHLSLTVLLLPFTFSLHALVAAAPIPTKSNFSFGMPEYKGNTPEELSQHVADTQHVYKVETEIRSQLDALHGHLTHAIAHPDQVHPSITNNFGHGANHQAILDKVTAMGNSHEQITHFRDPTLGRGTMAVHDNHGIGFHPDWHKLPVPLAASVAIHELSHGQGTEDYHYHGHPLGPDGKPQTDKPKAWHAISAEDVKKHEPHGMVHIGYMDHDHQHLVDHASHHTHLNADSYFGAAHQALHGTNVNPQHLLEDHFHHLYPPPSGSPKPGSPKPGSHHSSPKAEIVDEDGEKWAAWKKLGSASGHTRSASGPHGAHPAPAHQPPHHQDPHKHQ